MGKVAGANAEIVEGAVNALTASQEDVGVNHGSSLIAVVQQHLNGADVGAAMKQVGCEEMPKGLCAYAFGQTRARHRHLIGLVDDAGVSVVMAGDAGTRSFSKVPGREKILSASFSDGVGIFSSEGVGPVIHWTGVTCSLK